MNSIKLKEFLKRVGNTDDFITFKLRLRGLQREEKKIEVLWVIYKIIKNTDIFTYEVKEYFLSDSSSYKDISLKFDVSESNLKNRIFRQTKKFFDLLGSDLIEDVINNELNDIECEYILKDLKELLKNRKIKNNSIEDYFNEDIFGDANLNQDFSNIDEEDFLLARDILSRFSIPANDFMLNNLDSELKDYIFYLLITPDSHLLVEDKARKENVLAFFHL